MQWSEWGHNQEDRAHQFLGRDADAAGLTFFVTALKTGTRQEQVISIFVGSAEYFQRL